ncbi:methylated-DNA--[protein]-cysteine S-methyltransferase [Oerskovia jenensis]|uniref:Methylated-DNA--protein-cysteine methyltransferase n=1 Tax=Oerskovia jenensis TaxID=162169 RepID=A0ABS2LAU2_9CELL|nr:methylated-DNA--[protein]-cysteine S-methyltransferase [Oerskovia jenensis]MBM7477548.1 methylated-DNA-[protein]-cysteine S-methyltransferase [Oerskovia jenensis]
MSDTSSDDVAFLAALGTALDRGAAPADDSRATLSRLHERLAAGAASSGLLDVAYRTLDTPVGTLLLAATDVGVVRIAFDVEGHDAVLDRIARTVSPRVLRSPGRLDRLATEIDEYFAGERRAFDLPLDLTMASGPFRREVLTHLRDIGYGRTASYAQVAVAAGSPRAVRAVGTACAKNPLPLVVPCHRVVRSDGTSGSYAGGPEAKRLLLALEHAA